MAHLATVRAQLIKATALSLTVTKISDICYEVVPDFLPVGGETHRNKCVIAFATFILSAQINSGMDQSDTQKHQSSSQKVYLHPWSYNTFFFLTQSKTI